MTFWESLNLKEQSGFTRVAAPPLLSRSLCGVALRGRPLGEEPFGRVLFPHDASCSVLSQLEW